MKNFKECWNWGRKFNLILALSELTHPALLQHICTKWLGSGCCNNLTFNVWLKKCLPVKNVQCKVLWGSPRQREATQPKCHSVTQPAAPPTEATPSPPCLFLALCSCHLTCDGLVRHFSDPSQLPVTAERTAERFLLDY